MRYRWHLGGGLCLWCVGDPKDGPKSGRCTEGRPCRCCRSRMARMHRFWALAVTIPVAKAWWRLSRGEARMERREERESDR
jgi:hypothetical protein